ncbi:PilZ domain-containing protein [Dasania marina]|uniref:PilZ domain-containing protein n=1 Tax=Dasania marina TaxID=471499 RepID=UPI0030D7C21B|tara:strand:- start:62718 stop:63440 length:723 start_codon:yes stop_codon:yes gene_type:complete
MANKGNPTASGPSNKSISPASMLAKLNLGATVQVSSLDGSLTYLTRLIGVDSNKVLITALPTPKQMKKESVDVVYDNIFFPEKVFVMRLIAQGYIFAFQSQVIAVNYSGSKLLLSSFPKNIQSQPLRSDARLPCALSASCHYKEQIFSAVITDISQGGCQIQFDPSLFSGAVDTLKDQILQLTLRFHPGAETEKLNTNVSSINKITNHEVTIGLSFVEAEPSVNHYLESLQLGELSSIFL